MTSQNEEAAVDAALKAYFGDDYEVHAALGDDIARVTRASMRAALRAGRSVDVERLSIELAAVIMQQDEEFQSLKCLPDQLQELCDKHGCLAGSDRVEWLSSQLDMLAELAETLRMVRDADNDCRADGLATIPPMPRAKIDRALARYTQERISPENTPKRIGSEAAATKFDAWWEHD